MIIVPAASDEKFVEDAYWDTRNGAFIKIARGKDFRGLLRLARKNPVGWAAITSRGVVAQVWDQMGRYRLSSLLATLELGRAQLEILRLELPKAKSPEAPRRPQARAALVLQCAIAGFRRNEALSRAGAMELVNELIKLLEEYQARIQGSLQILNWIIFWRGRFLSTVDEKVREAGESFQKALELADRNLESKLIRDRDDSGKRSQQVAAANYMISAILGFGIAHLRQLEMRHEESLDYLKIAIPLARCNEDYYRQGFVHYLAGVALIEGNDPGEARRHLQIAYVNFGGRDKGIVTALTQSGHEIPKTAEGRVVPPHHLHLARTLHQLALLHLKWAGGAGNLRSVWELNENARKETDDKDCQEFRDPMLDYGIRVVRSLATGLAGWNQTGTGPRVDAATKRSFEDARRDAEFAIQMLDSRRVPRWMHGASYVAKGRAIADEAGEHPDPAKVKEAKNAFEHALSEDVRATERAAAHLYLSRLCSRVGEIFAAGLHYDQAKDLIEASKQSWVWVLDLAEQVREELGEQNTAFVRINVAQELARWREIKRSGTKKEEKQIWKNLSEDAMNKLRGQVLRFYREELLKAGGVKKVATELNVSQAAVYGWCKEDKYADLELSKRNLRQAPKRAGEDA